MDPRMMKLLGIALTMAPNDPDNGGGDEPLEETEVEVEGEGEGEIEGEGEGDDAEAGDDDDDEADDDDAGEGEDDGEGDQSGERVNKRIGKLVAESKEARERVTELERELKAAKALAGDDGKAILRAAETSGILPGLMSKDEAEAFTVIEQYPRVIENYQDWLDDHGPDDEYGSGSNAMSYGQVKKRVRKLESELADVKENYGDRRRELRRKVREIFEAGVEALKAKGKPRSKAKGEGEEPGRKPKPAKEERKVKKLLEAPETKSARHAHKPTKLEDMDVESDADLEEYIKQMRRKEG